MVDFSGKFSSALWYNRCCHDQPAQQKKNVEVGGPEKFVPVT
jgi:hypothetical protein